MLNTTDMHDCVMQSGNVHEVSKEDKSKTAAIAIGVTSAVVCASVALFVVWRTRARMREEVKAILLHYMPLEDFVPKPSSSIKPEVASTTTSAPTASAAAV